MIQTKKLEYYDGNTRLEAYYAYDNAGSDKKPAVLIAPDWSGRNDFACQKAEKLAELGYLGFTIDMYGDSALPTTKEEKMACMQPFMEDRDQLYQRILAGLTAMQTLSLTNTAKMAAIGFCFGGLCVLDLARHGANLRGVVSFHGLLAAPAHFSPQGISTKILALHGHDDPMVPPSQVAQFQEEMTQAKADWQLHIYGNTKHAFTNPHANDLELGTVYHALADKRSWIAMQDFLNEIFS